MGNLVNELMIFYSFNFGFNEIQNFAVIYELTVFFKYQNSYSNC